MWLQRERSCLPNYFLIVTNAAAAAAAASLSWSGSTLLALSHQERWGGARRSVSQLGWVTSLLLPHDREMGPAWLHQGTPLMPAGKLIEGLSRKIYSFSMYFFLIPLTWSWQYFFIGPWMTFHTLPKPSFFIPSWQDMALLCAENSSLCQQDLSSLPAFYKTRISKVLSWKGQEKFWP